MPRGRQSRQQAGATQNDSGKSERDRIARFKTKQQRRGELRRPHTRGGPDYHARSDHQTDATKDEANDAAWSEQDLETGHDTLRHLRDEGLVETVDLGRDERGLTLTKEGGIYSTLTL